VRLLLADFILVVHFAFVLFVVASLPLIWIGAAAGWRWIRNFRYRIAHLAAILVVSTEAVVGIWCPLTLWEDALRGANQDKNFIGRWIHAVLYYDLPAWAFTTAYLAFATLVGLTWWRVPPHRSSVEQ
jgi:hypothetical protein